jgi:hypothetical protein
MGMVTDATWSDYDQDGDRHRVDLGEWMPKACKTKTGT